MGSESTYEIQRSRKIRENSGSLLLSFPPEFIEFAEFEEGDEVQLEAPVGSNTITLTNLDKESKVD